MRPDSVLTWDFFRPQIGRQAFDQELQGGNGFGEDDQAIFRVFRIPAQAALFLAEQLQQQLVLAELLGCDVGYGVSQIAQERDVGLRLLGGFAALKPGDAIVYGRSAGGRAGVECFLERGSKQVSAAAGLAIQCLEANLGQLFQHRFFRRGGGGSHDVDLPLGQVATKLILYILLQAPNDQTLVAEILVCVIRRVGDSGRVEHVHQTGKAFGLAVVWCGRQHDERIGAGRQQAGQPGTLGMLAAFGHVMCLVNDDDVPPGLFEIMPVFDVLLEGIDGDDRPIEVMKWIVVGRQAVAHALQAGGIETHKGNGEAIPELLLELSQHGFDCQHQNALASPTSNQLGDQNAGFQCLAQANGISDQDSRTGCDNAWRAGSS